MEINITPLKDTMLKREANYLSSGSAQLGKFTPSKGQDLNQPYSREQQLCQGTTVPATSAGQGTPCHHSPALMEGDEYPQPNHHCTRTLPGTGSLLAACLASALHSCFHLNWGILNERKRAKVPSVPRRGKV